MSTVVNFVVIYFVSEVFFNKWAIFDHLSANSSVALMVLVIL